MKLFLIQLLRHPTYHHLYHVLTHFHSLPIIHTLENNPFLMASSLLMSFHLPRQSHHNLILLLLLFPCQQSRNLRTLYNHPRLLCPHQQPHAYLHLSLLHTPNPRSIQLPPTQILCRLTPPLLLQLQHQLSQYHDPTTIDVSLSRSKLV